MDEMVDIIDATGARTGEVLERMEAIRQGKMLKYAQVWIFNSKGELLVGQRAAGRRIRPNLLDTACAGHVSSGEDYATCAARELKEELGLDVPLEAMFEMHGDYGRVVIFRGYSDVIPAFDKQEMNVIEFKKVEDVKKLVEEFPYLLSFGFADAIKVYLEWRKNNG
ncbi:MAG: NUDIX domain-containing protein [Proteobacteria bacterium]|nr:NUDIX domain-containing protein [Pseudomonadota bacterium]